MKKQIALLYRIEAYIIPTIKESIENIVKYLEDFNVILIGDKNIHKIFKYKIDIVLIHYSITHSFAVGCNTVNTLNIDKINVNEIIKTNTNINLYLMFMTFIKTSNCIKICMCQDEYYNTIYIEEFLFNINVNVVFTVSPLEQIKNIYPRLNNTKFVNVLTGYFDMDNNLKSNIKLIKDRDNYVVYRGRRLHYSYGQLGQDKETIGLNMKIICEKHDLKNDISVNGEENIYGPEWYKFIGNSKTTLATDSGSNIYDRDNSLREKINNVLGINTNSIILPNGNVKYSYEYIRKYFHKDFEDKTIQQGQISPKMFEAIKLKTVLVMYEGRYSNILKPNKHFIELKRDLSNIDDVMKKIKDNKYLQNMAEETYNDIYKSNNYSYKKFADLLIENINNKFIFKPNYISKQKDIILKYVDKLKTKNIIMFRNEGFGYDPRRDVWYQSKLPENYLLIHICIGKNRYSDEIVENTLNIDNIEMSYMESICNLKKLAISNNILDVIDKIDKIINECDVPKNRKLDHKWLVENYFLKNSYLHCKAFLDNYSNHNISSIIIINAPLLLAGLIIKNTLNIPIFYESLELWSFSQYNFSKQESLFWKKIEKIMLDCLDDNDYKNTVSNKLAKHMSEIYDTKFNFLPNCVPISISSQIIKINRYTKTCKFLFQGGIYPHRGIDLLIDVWKDTDNNAILNIRGPNSEYKNKLMNCAGDLINKRIFFLDEIKSNKLLEYITKDCDIGVIPYISNDLNNLYCSPNKLGEFIAMGKPVLANNTENIKDILKMGDCGIIVDFSDKQRLIENINELTRNINLRKKLSENANNFYRSYFNWDNLSKDFYSKILI